MTDEIEIEALEKWILFNEDFSPKLTPNQFGQLLKFSRIIYESGKKKARDEILNDLIIRLNKLPQYKRILTTTSKEENLVIYSDVIKELQSTNEPKSEGVNK